MPKPDPQRTLPILQFERIRQNIESVFQAAEVSGVQCVKEYSEILDDLRSIESAFDRYMRVNIEQGSIITDLTNQNCELKHEQA